jgi:hypothetical protein
MNIDTNFQSLTWISWIWCQRGALFKHQIVSRDSYIRTLFLSRSNVSRITVCGQIGWILFPRDELGYDSLRHHSQKNVQLTHYLIQFTWTETSPVTKTVASSSLPVIFTLICDSQFLFHAQNSVQGTHTYSKRKGKWLAVPTFKA